MINNTHTIGAMRFELETYNKKHANEIQNSVSIFGREKIPRIIEESLSQADIGRSTAIIDKIEIDLGEITISNFKTDFLTLFKKGLNEKIGEFNFKNPSVRSKDIVVLDKEKSDFEILKHFLLSGTIPWYAESYPQDLQRIFKSLVELKPEYFLKFIETHLASTSFVQRMVYQFPETYIVLLLEIIFKTKLEEQLLFSKQFFSVVKRSQLLTAKIPYPDQMMLIVLIETLGIAKDNTGIGFKENYLNILARKLNIKNSKLLKEISERVRELKLIPVTKELFKTAKGRVDKWAETGEKDDVISKKIETEPDKKTGPESYYISNAGLSLLNPFLSELFRKLKLTTKNKFINEAAVHKAIHLSQYAVFGNKAKPEYLLVFNKLICGYPLEKPIPIKVNLSRREKSETTRMVNAAIKHWSVLKNTSASAFRNSFLRRNGLLKKTEKGWKVHVEREAYDLLLDKIPWNYRIIKLPWMNNLIEVEW